MSFCLMVADEADPEGINEGRAEGRVSTEFKSSRGIGDGVGEERSGEVLIDETGAGETAGVTEGFGVGEGIWGVMAGSEKDSVGEADGG